MHEGGRSAEDKNKPNQTTFCLQPAAKHTHCNREFQFLNFWLPAVNDDHPRHGPFQLVRDTDMSSPAAILTLTAHCAACSVLPCTQACSFTPAGSSSDRIHTTNTAERVCELLKGLSCRVIGRKSGRKKSIKFCIIWPLRSQRRVCVSKPDKVDPAGGVCVCVIE